MDKLDSNNSHAVLTQVDTNTMENIKMSYVFGINYMNNLNEDIFIPIAVLTSEEQLKYINKFIDSIFEEYPNNFKIASHKFIYLANIDSYICYDFFNSSSPIITKKSFCFKLINNISLEELSEQNNSSHICPQYSLKNCCHKIKVFNARKCKQSVI